MPELKLAFRKNFLATEVPLDGHRYIECRFENVTLIYNGGRTAVEQNEFFGAIVFRSDKPEIEKMLQLLFHLGALKGNAYGPDGPIEASFIRAEDPKKQTPRSDGR